MCPIYLYVINEPPCYSVYTAKRLNKRSLLLFYYYCHMITKLLSVMLYLATLQDSR